MAIDQRVEDKAIESAGVDSARQPQRGRAAAELFDQQRAKLGNERFMQELAEGRGRPLSEGRRLDVAERSSDDTAERNDAFQRLEQFDLLAKTGGFDSMPPALKQQYRREVLSSLGPNFGDILTGPPPLTGPEQNALAESILKDSLFTIELNARVHAIANGSRFDPEPRDISRVVAQLRASDPTKYSDDKTARTEAYKQLKADHQRKLQDDIDSAAQYATQQVIKSNIESAHVVVHDKAAELDNRTRELSTEAGKRSGDGIAERLRQRWDTRGAFDKGSGWVGRHVVPGALGGKRPEGAGLADYDSFARHGLTNDFLSRCGVNAADIATLQANPELRKEYEKTIRQDLLLRKLESGTLSKEDMRRLEHAPWMGSTPQERVETIKQMFETRQEFRNLENAAKAGGMLDTDFWNKAKDAAAKGTLPGGLAGLLAILLGLPIGGVAIALGAAGGTYVRRMQQANKESRTFDLAA